MENLGSAAIAGTPSADVATTAAGETNNINAAVTNAAAPVEVAALLKEPIGQIDKDAWYTKLNDEGLRGYAETRNWKNVDSVVESYKNLETLMGADKAGRGVVLPNGDEDVEGWNNLYTKLGRPEKSEDYKLSVPEGYDGTMTGEASKWMHEAGLSSKQAAMINDKYNEYLSNTIQQAEAKRTEALAKEFESLKTEWGNDYDRNIELARRGATATGLDADAIQKIEQSIGTKAMLQMFDRIGKSYLEDKFEGNTKSNPFGMSPEAARVRIKALMKDQDFSKKLLSGDSVARQEWDNLNRVSVSGGA